MRKFVLSLFFIPLFLLISCASAGASQVETTGDNYFTLVDENNNVVDKTGLGVSIGDIYIAADNSKYKVVEVDGTIAKCKYQGIEQMPEVYYNAQKQAYIFDQTIPAAANKKTTIAIYHTHDDESYVPTDGKESIRGDGGIFDVGKSLVSKLKAEGFNVLYSKAKHDPHDVNAYNRSRKTAASLLRKSPDAIIDVHRDAVPANVYQTQVKGQSATKVKLVLGRQNPNMKANMEFAKKIKAVMDKKEPGLSNGIYIGKGDYNQDLSPQAILIEVGAHTNSKIEAEKGVSLFAETLPSIFGLSSAGTTANTTTATPAEKPMQKNSQGASTIIVVMLVVLGLGAGAYYFLNKGGVRQK